jgi:hypothetical protein
MTFAGPVFSHPEPTILPSSITFCSCAPLRTELEQTLDKREITVMWIKDAAAGFGLVIFMVSSFVLAGAAHSVLSLL